MRKVLFPLMAFLLFFACKKETSPDLLSDEISSKAAKGKIEVCHYDKETGTSHTITINANALDAHLAHGDLLGDCSAVLVTICEQDWMVKNLDVIKYRDGTPIPEVTDPTVWANLTTGAWCYYENNSANGTTYGKLYNWYAVAGIYDAASLVNPALRKKLAPTGFHIPNDAEWKTLIKCLDPAAVQSCVQGPGCDFPSQSTIAGGKMKSTGTIIAGTGLWDDPNTGATNSSGFTGLPGGFRIGIDVAFYAVKGVAGIWYSSDEVKLEGFEEGLNSFFILNTSFTDVFSRSSNKNEGFSVRCVRD
jgi:uncharacterized protein (TIGR02145 family)